MLVRRVIAWARGAAEGGLVHAGEIVEMEAGLALLHIRCGDAEAVEALAAPGAEESTEESAPSLRDRVDALHRKDDAIELAKELGVDIDPKAKLLDMRAELELALEALAAPAADPT